MSGTPAAGVEHRVGAIDDIEEGGRSLARIGDRDIAVFRIKGELRAWENRCPHQGGPVCTGRVLGRTELELGDDQTVIREVRSTDEIHVACPWHGWEYNLETGVCAALPSRKLRGFEVTERDGAVYVVVP